MTRRGPTSNRRRPVRTARDLPASPVVYLLDLLYLVTFHGCLPALQAARMSLNLRVRLALAVFVDVRLVVPFRIRDKFSRSIDALQ